MTKLPHTMPSTGVMVCRIQPLERRGYFSDRPHWHMARFSKRWPWIVRVLATAGTNQWVSPPLLLSNLCHAR